MYYADSKLRWNLFLKIMFAQSVVLALKISRKSRNKTIGAVQLDSSYFFYFVTTSCIVLLIAPLPLTSFVKYSTTLEPTTVPFKSKPNSFSFAKIG